MKRSYLTALGLEKDIIDQIMSEHGNTVEILKERSVEQADAFKEQVASLKADNSTLQGEVKNLKDSAPVGDDGLQKKFEELQSEYNAFKETSAQEFSQYKEQVETEKSTSAIKSDISDRLIKDGAKPNMVKLLLKEVDLGKAELADGKLTNYDVLTKDIKEGYADVFGTTVVDGAGVATPPANNTGEADPFLDGFDA